MGDINDFFRAMFGFGGRRPPEGYNNRPEERTFIFFDSDDEDDEVPWGDGHSGHFFGGNIFSHFMRDMEQMNREMANMFQSFEIGFPSEHSGNPRLPSNPRDDMLKTPDSIPENSGVDRGQPDIGQRGMGPGFSQPSPFFRGFFSPPRPNLPAPSESSDSENPQAGQHDNPWMPHMSSFSSGRSVSVSTSIGANGQVEERRTVRDSEGCEEVTVTRKQGSQAHSVTTKTDKSGVQEKIENFTNMNESDLADFNNRWKNKNEQSDFSAPPEPNSLLKSPAQPCEPQLCPPQSRDSDKDTVLTSRLKRLFDWLKPKVE